MAPIKLAVIGCGEIAQIMHLPYLAELPDFEIAAVSDLSPSVAQAVANQYNVGKWSTDYAEVLDDVDAVAVLTNEHADIAEHAASRGRHVFVEKPLSHSLEDCNRVLAAARKSGVKLMVGYMRRFDPGYEFALERIAALEDIRFVHVHDFGGSFSVHPQIYRVHRPDDVPLGLIEENRRRITDTMMTALGPDSEHLVDVYYEVLMSGTHDLAMMRGILGSPARVLHSERVGTNGLISLLDYGAGRICSFELVLMVSHSWWDQRVAVYADSAVISINLPNPYIRNAATTVEHIVSDGDSPITQASPVSYDSPFRREWVHFAYCIRRDAEPLSNGEDARADVAIALAMVQAIK
jgi:predicted dehydrogenase